MYANFNYEEQAVLNLYKDDIREFQVGEGDDPEANAQAVKDWFMKRHPTIHVLLSNHVSYETWDRIARNKKRGFDALLEVAPGNFTREEIKHARSRALPENMAATVNVKWTGVLEWKKGFYKDGNSCLFGEAARNLHNMANRGVSMLGFYDETKKDGIGRLFVKHTGGRSEKSGVHLPVGLYAFEGVGHLGEMGYMPTQSGGDILQQLTNLPHKVVIGSGVTWVGKIRPSEEEREALAKEPYNYNQFDEVEGVSKGIPPAFQCKCGENIPQLTSRVYVPDEKDDQADRRHEINERVELAMAAYRQVEADPGYTAAGRKTAVYERALRGAAESYHTAVADLSQLDANKLIPVCLECHYAELLRA